MKYKIIQAEHQSWGVESCEDEDCPNVHLWFTKQFGGDTYYFAFSKPLLWNYGNYCLSKEICIPEKGIIREITRKLEDNKELLEVAVSEELIEILFRGGYKKHLPLLQF